LTFIDARKVEPGRRFDGDLCIIGAGAAGLAIARRFVGRRERVLLLESGGESTDAATQALNEGRVAGQSHAPLSAGRLRGFGGTTQHWTAHVRRLDPLDFAQRAWVPDSGWPFSRETLDPYYERAERLLGLPERAFELEAWQTAGPAPPLAGRGRFSPQLRQVVTEERRRFGPRFKNEVAHADNVRALLHATVMRIVFSERRNAVSRLEVGTLAGGRFEVAARRYVLAAGAIENARLLLLSGFDGEGRVGAYYANHPEGWMGHLQPGHRLDMRFFRPRRHAHGTLLPLLVLEPRAQEAERLPGCWVQPILGADARAALRGARAENKQPRLIVRSALEDADVARLARDMDREAPSSAAGRVPRAIGFRLIGEPTPNPESRVRLGDPSDALGQRRVVLDWRLREQDSQSVRRTIRLLAREVGATGMGRFRSLFPSAGYASIRTIGSHHHMGTTRMHRDAKRGVVDADARVHGIANLFVAGSSVFPTFGTANPTLTLLALAERLADHLQAKG